MFDWWNIFRGWRAWRYPPCLTVFSSARLWSGATLRTLKVRRAELYLILLTARSQTINPAIQTWRGWWWLTASDELPNKNKNRNKINISLLGPHAGFSSCEKRWRFWFRALHTINNILSHLRDLKRLSLRPWVMGRLITSRLCIEGLSIRALAHLIVDWKIETRNRQPINMQNWPDLYL